MAEGGWKEKALRARARLRNMSEKSEVGVQTMVNTAEVSAAAFIAGVVQGRTGGVEVVGVPLDLGLGAGLHVLAFAGFGGKLSSHLHSFGDGFLAAYLCTTGRGVGQGMKEKAGVSGWGSLGAGNAGSLPGARLTDEDRAFAAFAQQAVG